MKAVREAVSPDGSRKCRLTDPSSRRAVCTAVPDGHELYHLGIAVDGDCEKLGKQALAFGCLIVPGKGKTGLLCQTKRQSR